MKTLKSLLDKAKVEYTRKMRKKALITLLTDNVDSRYYLLAMTMIQLRDKLRSRKESHCGRKAELIDRIWKKETNELISRTKYGDIIESYSENKADIIQILRKHRVRYKSSDEIETLIDLLAEHVDIRFKFWKFDIDKLESEYRSRQIWGLVADGCDIDYDFYIDESCDKQVIVDRLWNFGLEDARRSVVGLPAIGPTNHRIHTETAAPLHREPISDFLRLKTVEELISEYKAFTGKDVMPGKVKTVEDISRDVARLCHQKKLDAIFGKRLNPDTLSVVMSFLPTDTYDQDMRVKMTEDAKQYIISDRSISSRIIGTLQEMQFYNETPEYIDEDATELRRSQLFLVDEGGIGPYFPAIFAKYYNTYIRGDMSRLEEAYDDLKRKSTLYKSSGRVVNKSTYSLWKGIMNYDDRLTMRQRMDKLNILRPKLYTLYYDDGLSMSQKMANIEQETEEDYSLWNEILNYV